MVLSSQIRQIQSRRECGWLLSLNGMLLFTLLSPFTLSFNILSKVNRIAMTVKAFPVTYKNESRGTWSTRMCCFTKRYDCCSSILHFSHQFSSDRSYTFYISNNNPSTPIMGCTLRQSANAELTPNPLPFKTLLEPLVCSTLTLMQ